MSAGPSSQILLDPRGLRPTELRPPRSKSDAQRALALAYALDDPDFAPLDLDESGLPGDVRALGAGLAALRTSGATVSVGDGGAPLRILVGQAAATAGAHLVIHGSRRLAERPHGPLFASLRATLGPAGLRLDETQPGLFPLTVVGASEHAPRPRFSIRAAESSQFPTSLLLCAARLARLEGRAWEVALDGPLASEGYLDLTLDWLARAGVEVRRDGAIYTVGPSRGPVRRGPIPGDWSSLGYLLPIAWRSGGQASLVDVTVEHPDRAIVDVLMRAGLTVEVDGQGLAQVHGSARSGVYASGADCPDLLPTVAALACVLPEPSTLSEVSILRIKESDRLAGIETLVRAGGGRVVPLPDDQIRIEPGPVPRRLSLSSAGDHRLAMAAATLAVLAGSELELEGPEVVDKSFPGFFDVLTAAGVTVTPA